VSPTTLAILGLGVGIGFGVWAAGPAYDLPALILLAIIFGTLIVGIWTAIRIRKHETLFLSLGSMPLVLMNVVFFVFSYPFQLPALVIVLAAVTWSLFKEPEEPGRQPRRLS
jgi:hypothetical protein